MRALTHTPLSREEQMDIKPFHCLNLKIDSDKCFKYNLNLNTYKKFHLKNHYQAE